MKAAAWSEVAARLAPARSYWLASTDLAGAPHVAPVWGVVVAETFHLYSERTTAKARHVLADPRVALHLEDPEDVVIVHGRLEDLGSPHDHPDVLRALSEKYAAPEDAGYLPSGDPDFDVLWALRPTRALLWNLADYDASQARWRSSETPTGS